MSAPAAVEFKDVTKDYPAGWVGWRALRAVSGVSLRVEQGEVVGLVGPNRAGKTTLVKILLTLARPTSGAVWRFGRPSADRSTLARVGYVHESPAFPRYLTARGLLEYYAALGLVPRREADRRIPELLERVGLADRAREPIARYSKGMVQRLALAQALVNRPDLLVLDEPSEGLDSQGRRLMHQLVEEERKRGGSVLLVSHVLADIEQLCDRVGLMVEGRLAQCGSIGEMAPESPKGRNGHRLEEVLLSCIGKARR